MFDIGEKVVCVDDRAPPWANCPLENGKIYTVTDIFVRTSPALWPDGVWRSGHKTVRLKEVCHEFPDLPEAGFAASRFRKLPKLDTSAGLSALKSLTVKRREPVEAG